MLDITDQIIADLEQQVYELRCEIRDLKASKEVVKEVTVAGIVTLKEYKKLEKLYYDLWNETQSF